MLSAAKDLYIERVPGAQNAYNLTPGATRVGIPNELKKTKVRRRQAAAYSLHIYTKLRIAAQ